MCVLAARGVLATDIEPRAVECARENAAALGFAGAITVEEADLFPHAASRTAAPASLIVCNPPWMPCTPAGIVHNGSSIGVGAALDRAVFDPAGAVLSRLLAGLGSALAPGGESEAWLLLSDLPERVGLCARGELLDAIARAGLAVRGRRDAPALIRGPSRARHRTRARRAARGACCGGGVALAPRNLSLIECAWGWTVTIAGGRVRGRHMVAPSGLLGRQRAPLASAVAWEPSRLIV